MDYEDQEDEQDGEIGSTPPTYDDSPFLTKSPCPAEPPPPPPRKSRYRKCLKNHAVGIGGHAVDGCGEFIPAGEDNTPDSLRCAACGCHRNFHRKEPDPADAGFSFPHLLTHHGHFGYRGPSGYLHVSPAPPPQRPQTLALLALPSNSGGGGSVPRSEDLEDYYYSNNNNAMTSKKRFRTKFTAEQKEKMLSFAEEVGWRIQKQDEESVQRLCEELGIKRHVLKVWMHNNKHTLACMLLPASKLKDMMIPVLDDSL